MSSGETFGTATGKRMGDKRLRSLMSPVIMAGIALAVFSPRANAACGGIATAFCVSAFSTAETPPGVGAIPHAAFSFMGPGAFSVTLSEPLFGFTGVRVLVTDGGEAKVVTGGRVTAANGDGVSASSDSGPVVATIGAGGVVATGVGVKAVSAGAGNINITGSGPVTAGTTGIYAASKGGNIFINETGAIAGATGITAFTLGSGGLTVMTAGAVTGTSGEGISTATQNGLNALVVGAGGVGGATNGINASAAGTGNLSLTIGGPVSGTSGAGLIATTASGNATITIGAGASLTGATSGLNLSSQSGQASVVSNGLIVSTGAQAILTNMGTGLASLSNNGIVRGAVAVANAGGGLAIVNNATMEGTVTTAAGATTTLSNVGAWTKAGGSTISTLANTGTLSFGPAGGALTTLDISGSAAFAATSKIDLRMNTTGADRIVVGGPVAIVGGTLSISVAPGVYTIGQAQQVLTASGGVTGNFTRAIVTSGYFTSIATASASGISVTLGYGRLEPIALTANQLAAAKAFDAATRTPPTGDAGKLMSALYSQSGDAPLATLGQMNADAPGAAANAGLAAGSAFSGALTARQESLRAPIPAATVASRVEASWYTGASAARATPEVAGRLSVWSAGFGGAASYSGDRHAGSSAQTNTVKGGAMGLDYRVGAFSAGIVGGVSGGDFKAGAASGTARGAHVGVHAGMAMGAIYANASVTGADYTIEASRQTTAPLATAAETQKGNTTAREVRARFEAGMYSNEDGFHIKPFVAVEVAQLQMGRYNETLGAGGASPMSLAYAARSIVSAPVFLGVRLEGNLVLSNGAIVTPKVSLAWRHELAPSRDFSTALATMPGARFNTRGARPDANALQAKMALEAQISRHVAVFASLEGDFSARYRAITGRGGATLTW